MSQIVKPAEGSWTEHYPELGTGLVSYEDSISPEFYELEREAIFKRAWLNVGRVEQVPRKGSFFTKDIAIAKASVIIVRGHGRRGARLPQRLPAPRQQDPVGPLAPRDGERHLPAVHVQVPRVAVRARREAQLRPAGGGVLRLRQGRLGLVPVHCDVWEGFIFVNLDRRASHSRCASSSVRWSPDSTATRSTQMTERYGYRASVNANWKIFLDAFQEYYHVPILHSQQQVPRSCATSSSGFSVPHFQLDGPHRLISTGGWKGTPRHLMDPSSCTPSRRGEAGLMGPWQHDRPELDVVNLPAGVNPGRLDPWSVSTFNIFPNFVILLYERGWYLTYHYWPTSHRQPRLGDGLLLPGLALATRADPARGHRGHVEGGGDPGHGARSTARSRASNRER